MILLQVIERPTPFPKVSIRMSVIERPAYALAHLHRRDQGEIVIRQHGFFVERRYFDLARCACTHPMDHGDLLCP
ncbi:hypothetical protein ACFSC4_29980, partial [Deinococcus malanensis]